MLLQPPVPERQRPHFMSHNVSASLSIVDTIDNVDYSVKDTQYETHNMVMVRQFDEEKVLDKVLQVFWTQGWQATSMADLATAANVQRGSLYHAYGSKEQLFQLAFDRYAANVLLESKAALETTPAQAALEQFFDVAIASMTSAKPPRGCFTTKTAIEGDAIGGEIKKRVLALLESLESSIAQVLSRDEIRSSLSEPPEKVAQVIITYTRGLAVMERIHRDPQKLRDLSSCFISCLIRHGDRNES